MEQIVRAVYEKGVFRPLDSLKLDEHALVSLTVRSQPRAEQPESFYDAAARLGLIGCLVGGPPDLSANPRYMEGFGEDDHGTHSS